MLQAAGCGQCRDSARPPSHGTRVTRLRTTDTSRPPACSALPAATHWPGLATGQALQVGFAAARRCKLPGATAHSSLMIPSIRVLRVRLLVTSHFLTPPRDEPLWMATNPAAVVRAQGAGPRPAPRAAPPRSRGGGEADDEVRRPAYEALGGRGVVRGAFSAVVCRLVRGTSVAGRVVVAPPKKPRWGRRKGSGERGQEE